MKTKPTENNPTAAATSSRRPAKRRGPGPAPGTREANKLAVAILDVLAGARLPAEAAQAVGVSLPRYYQLEQRALDAIVKACEPRAKGPGKNPQRQVAQLQRQVVRLTQECSRQQALVRAAQRTIGLAPPAASKPASGTAAAANGAKRKRQRKPTVRALKASRQLRQALDAQEEQAASGGPPSPETERSNTHPEPALAGNSLVTGGSS